MDELTKEALKLYHPPFKFVHGYIYDSKNEIVADQAEFLAALEVRGWGRIKYMDNAENLQDRVGELIAQALTEFWKKNLQEAIK